MGVKINVPYHKLVLVAQPAAGTNFSLVAAGQGAWRVISIAFRFVTDANVADRSVRLIADDGTSVYFRSPASAVQPATTTVDFGAFTGASDAGIAAGSQQLPLPTDGLILQPGWRLSSSTGLIQAGDQYSAIVAMVEEFPNGPGTEWTPTTIRDEYDRS